MARAIAHRFTGRGPERDDLLQVAYLGLVKAAQRYDPSQGGFSSFAAPTVRGELKRHFRDRGWMVRPPRWIQELQVEIRTVTDTHVQEFGDPPSDQLVADTLATPIARIREARGARGCYTPRSFDAPAQDSGRSIGETITVTEDGYELVDDLASLSPACHELDSADRELLRMRFFEERTQQDIADELGISQMQVSRRLSRLLAHLREQMPLDAA